ncbi:LuxR C-terminal-related transcriptional regulator [Rhizobium mongolense]|uniref:DNA-binding CsgD family transcriptional regulator n=2 Tax=Rhizobium mongolense TaxID=57676 RepID=A0ABR6ISR7_9HYPH|nr:LuxR C-terminal-related transcriptional regulator [Rhizobium mongolense]MBB4230735.1 DNA-binding CsgD family transcriptional regulator [Rhizobium mongolense]TVZ65893.1 regulatory LuxR family protein [Rhizobium mongolense USDA 1844]
MSISVVTTAADDPYDWHFRRIKDFGFKSRMLDRLRGQLPNSYMRDLDRSFVDDAIIPTFSRAVESRRPTIDLVRTKLIGVRIGYERLILPQKCDGKPAWCVSFIEGRYFIPPVQETKVDMTDEGIIQLLIEGQTAKEIAEFLNLSPRTIEHRIDKMKLRPDAKNLVHLVAKLVATQLDRRQSGKHV